MNKSLFLRNIMLVLSFIIILSSCGGNDEQPLYLSNHKEAKTGVFIDGPVGAKTFCTGLFLGSGEDVFVIVSDGCGDMFFMARAKKGSSVRSVEGDLGGIGDFGGG